MSESIFAIAYGGSAREASTALAKRNVRAPRRAIQARGRFDAAQTTADNRKHWANADSLGPNAALLPEIRRVLRDRARYEIANNSFAKGMVRTLANDTIGTGPRLQMLTLEPKINAAVEELWADWSAAIDLAGKLHTLRMTKVDAGEGFGMFTTNRRLDAPVKLDFKLIEPDQVTSPLTRMTTPGEVDGIRFDEDGNPTEYDVLRFHPGELWNGLNPYDVQAVPASSMIHYFSADRPGQARGIPEITAALPLFAQLRRYTLAVIAAAETAADYAAVIYSNAAADEDVDNGAPFEEIELAQRMATVLPKGWQLGQIKAEQPTTTYVEFVNAILCEIARCLNMPFNVAAGNSSNYNYASGRLDHQVYFKAIGVEQHRIRRLVLDPLFRKFLDEAVLVEGLLPQSLRMRGALPKHSWFWDGTEHVDPAKAANAQATRLANGMTTRAAEYAKEGKDWEPEMEQQARELKKKADLEKKFGVKFPVPAGTAVPDEDDEEEDSNAGRRRTARAA